MTDELKDLIDRAIVRMEEHYDFYTDGDASQYLGDATINAEGHCYAVSLMAEHRDIEPLLEARVKAIRAAREARYARIEAVLRFYADRLNWIPSGEGTGPVLDDEGEIARKALEGLSDEPPTRSRGTFRPVESHFNETDPPPEDKP